MVVYRLASAKYAPENCEGARLHGGRWNEKGTAVLYTSSSLSLAATEVIAQGGMIAADYREIYIHLPNHLDIEHADLKTLGIDWHTMHVETAKIGSEWASSLRTAALCVPSAVIRTGNEFNFILNPLHPGSKAIRFEVPTDTLIDERLRKAR